MAAILYIDACGGLSGDMLAGALLDLGWPLQRLEDSIKAMGLAGVRVSQAAERHMGIRCSRLAVEVVDQQPHRHLSQVLAILDRLPREIALPAAKVFQGLARAEAKVHGVNPEEVHFHEVGAADALVDVAAFCDGLAWLGAPRVVCSPLPLGRGFVDCAHGRLPLPAPAVLNLLEGVPVKPWPAEEETVTPTGAALVAALAQEFGAMPEMRIQRSGLGGGSRPSSAAPNVVRLLLGEDTQGHGHGEVVEIVCHIDDMSPEDLPMVLERLLAAGALDAAAAPLYMKKGRPGLMLVVVCGPEKIEELSGLILSQTSSLGVRLGRMDRRTLYREVLEVASPWGPARVKRARVKGSDGRKYWRFHPEADDVARISRETGLAPAQVRERLTRLAEES
ncbi:hypothetical protein AAU61_07900 [Desulfocarbo indianensis]|nr:hypothetical protein AAU61_07900 [Desulfocarbo indianensis]